MKSLIIFMALLILATSFMLHQSETGRFVQTQNYAKAICEDVAAGVALYLDWNEYSYGRYIFDRNEADALIRDLLIIDPTRGVTMTSESSFVNIYYAENIGKNHEDGINGYLYCEVHFFDDNTFDKNNAYGIFNDMKIKAPSIGVVITVKTDELPEIRRSCLYALDA